MTAKEITKSAAIKTIFTLAMFCMLFYFCCLSWRARNAIVPITIPHKSTAAASLQISDNVENRAFVNFMPGNYH